MMRTVLAGTILISASICLPIRSLYGQQSTLGESVQDAPAVPEHHTIHLVYDDATLPDAARAKLISLLAQQPRGDLKTITVTSADNGITKLIQNHFHLSGITDSLSVAALVTSIRSLNNLTSDKLVEGQTLLVPAIPLHVFRWNKLEKPAFRVAGIGAKAMSAAAGPQDLQEADFLPDAKMPRNGDLTAKELLDPRALADEAWRLGTTPLLPPGVLPLEDGGNIRIRLAGTSQCTGQQWLLASPLYSELRTSMAETLVQPDKHALLLSTASTLPLIVIDWNDSDKKHGQKVTSVVKYLLHQLNMDDLPFHEVDLNPINNSVELQSIFTEYLNNYYCSLQGVDCKSKGQKGLIDDVTQWLKSKPKATNGIASLKQLLLEAVLWKYFSASKAVVNMSFSIDSLALEIMQAQFLAASHSIGIAAASDDPQPEGTVGIPQRAASVYPNFLNVTYGNQDGTILGGFSNSNFNIIVTTIAQGCGYNYGDITDSDSGTSFAAPYVATALWLKALLDGGDTSGLRRDLVEASNVSRLAQLPPVESSGPFDLPTLILPSAYYVLDNQASPKEITSGTFRIISIKDSGGTVDESFKPGEHVSIAFFRVGSALRARIRERNSGSPLPVAETTERTVTDATLDVVFSQSGSAGHYDMGGIGTAIVAVKF